MQEKKNIGIRQCKTLIHADNVSISLSKTFFVTILITLLFIEQRNKNLVCHIQRAPRWL
jgi:hypothetical protein